MPYSKEVLERFEQVTNNPQKFNVGRFDPKDPNVATGMAGDPRMWRRDATSIKTRHR